mgnify:CR=1 FL=1
MTTPRTDENEFVWDNEYTAFVPQHYCYAGFARQLERDLAARDADLRLECDNTDKLLTDLGLEPTRYRTEGGILQPIKAANAVKEAREAELATMKLALDKINAIRNSIIGFQKINWSEHVYPLVAALDAAGIKGMPYDEAREKAQTLLQRAEAAEREAEEAARVRSALEWLLAHCDNNPEGETDFERAVIAARAAIAAKGEA